MGMRTDLSKEEHKRRIEQLMNSKEFYELERQISVNNPKFGSLTKQLKIAAVYLLQMGLENEMPDLWRYFYTRKIPTMDEWLTTKYIGPTASFLFPKWEEVLTDTFKPGSLYFELILGGSIGCLTGDTLIAQPHGRYISIEELASKGTDYKFPVISIDPEFNSTVAATGTNAHLTKRNADVFEVCFNDGSSVKATDNHPFMLQSLEYKEAKDLVPGDVIRTISRYNPGRYDQKVFMGLRFPQKADVYDLTVPKYENFAIDDGMGRCIFVHNSGKTTAANLCHEYNLFRVMSLRHPQMSLGVPPTTPLVLSLFSVTLEKAQLAVMGQFTALLRECPFFVQVKYESDFLDFKSGEKTPYIDEGDKLLLPNGVMVLSGSRVSHALSFSMIGASLDESEFRQGGVEDAIKTYNSLRDRVTSRFMGSRFVFLTMMSSAAYTIGIMADYMKNIKPDDPHSRYVAFPLWEIKYKQPYEKGHFWYMRGTQTHPHRKLSQIEGEMADLGEYQVPENCKLIKVPDWPEYRKSIEGNPSHFLKDIAGEQILAGEFLFQNTKEIEYDFLVPEVRIPASIKDPTPLLQKLPAALFVDVPGGKRLARYPAAHRYIHLDLAEVAEAGICMLHKEYSVGEGGLKLTKYVTDFVGYIVAPDRIDLELIQNLIIDLAYEIGVSIIGLSSDQFQSSEMRQIFEKRGIMYQPETFKPMHVSVDKTNVPYTQLSSVVAKQHFACGKAPKLREQLTSVQMDEAGKIFTHIRKDMADSVAGATHTAIMTIEDEPIYLFKELTYENIKGIETIDVKQWRELGDYGK